MEILLILTVGALNVACFFIGAKVGQKVTKGEPVEVSLPEPLKAIREREDAKEAKREQERLETILRNIDNYDGSENGQEEVPRG